MPSKEPLVLALTGTPGTGKTTVATILATRGFDVVNLTAFVLDHDVLTEDDPERDTRIVDHTDVNRALEPRILEARDGERPLVLEGHWAHDLDDVDLVAVLRTHPATLEARLRARGWAEPKVRENAEAEAVGIVAMEAREHPGSFELDTTDRTAEETAEALIAALQDHRLRVPPGTVDWIQRAPDWFR